jgi:hypothetical protein
LYTTEFTATVPEGMHDRSVNVFTLTEEGPSDMTLTVTRDRLRPGEDLAGYIDRQLAQMQQRFAQLRVRRREAAVVGGYPGERLEVSWQSPSGPLTQRQVALVSPLGPVMVFGATFRGAPCSEHATAFEQFVAGVHFHTPQR